MVEPFETSNKTANHAVLVAFEGENGDIELVVLLSWK